MRHLLVVTILIVAFFGTTMAQSPNPMEMQAILEGYLSKETPPSRFKLFYEIGDANSGHTVMNLNGKGKYKITSTLVRGAEFAKFKGRISQTQVEKLAKTMLTMKLWEFKHINPRAGNDEAIPYIKVSAKGKSYGVACYGSEIRFSMPFYTAQEMILDIIHRESNDLILEEGR